MTDENKEPTTTNVVETASSVIPNEGSPSNYDWSVDHERILAEWADKAMCYRWLHTRANSLYSYLNAHPGSTYSIYWGAVLLGLIRIFASEKSKNE